MLAFRLLFVAGLLLSFSAAAQKGSASGLSITEAASDSTGTGVRICLDCPPPRLFPPPLYVVDGQRLDSARHSKLTPDQIDSIILLKGQEAISRYGEQASNGAVLITTKRKK